MVQVGQKRWTYYCTIVLGGHSLNSGGLYALVEAAWARGEDLARHVEKLEVGG